MLPVDVSQVRNQAVPGMPVVPEDRTAHPPAGNSRPDAGYTLPEDVVRLSSDRSVPTDQSLRKKPSVSVTPVERKALRENFSIYA